MVQQWGRTLAGEPGGSVLVDVGTSTVSGVRGPGAPELAAKIGYVGHPVLQTLALDAADTAALGSHFARTGLLYEQPRVSDDDTFTDPFGVEWLWSQGAPAPLNHPLEDADPPAVARHPRPEWPRLVQPAPRTGGAARPLVVADAPCSGLIETCFQLRNSWQFMMDITDNWRVANALLDWALESVATGYERMLAALPSPPDVVLYGDDYGYQGGMFLSDEDFRTFVRPRLRTLFSRIRRQTAAAVCFHCCGAVASILPDLADLGVELVNLQYDAKGMELDRVRAQLPASMVLHGYTDLLALGHALAKDDRRSIAVLTDELVRSAPVVAAPVDSLATEEELFAVARAAHFVRALTDDDIERLRRLGPVREVLDRAAAAAAHEVPRLAGGTPSPEPAHQSSTERR
ncbi:uroporphyrinogen decarboxylase family protein [Streptomyces sp. NPDC047002]|uniref:uroporphyrinogen decarboxylase family protein n=1 Tax=Streptomyces sp. NPDC047002 TaxID=3155475 RepID=UPI00345248D1